ncbi:bifunctional DNA primase/polymerase [Streptomyces sp. NBC_00481]|uniref:bifunctional DNA primase/polymerase n=1 Tax=Streptomyces sp. NBC_00481 TaxID=2975755 RepID=UPI002DD7E315|nr:bifunctional DNA primase/polymerase [Streptomyces sp. NBC_00481]WRY99055.1 bifunctional DNA primase/polymerase [Streptomyces sp. NBC_00481]
MTSGNTNAPAGAGANETDQLGGGSIVSVARPLPTVTTDWHNARDNALQAAQNFGFEVIPLSVRKLPAIRSPHDKGHGCKGECGQLGHGIHDASSDPDRIHAMFAATRHATGYGIACGRAPHHLIGLDLDRKNGVDGVWELRKLAAKHGIAVPRTVIIRTPSGGFHAWWTGPADVKVPNRAGHVAPGVDVRGAGGYLVGPGSRGTSGSYTLASDPDEVVVQPIPEQLLTLMTASNNPPRTERPFTGRVTGGRTLVGLVRVVLDAPQGQRNTRLYWAACKAFEHAGAGLFPADSAHGALTQAAAAVDLPDNEAAATIASARRAVLGATK